jgi:hypothetical protein
MMLNVPVYHNEQLMLSASETPMDAFLSGMPPATLPASKQVSERVAKIMRIKMINGTFISSCCACVSAGEQESGYECVDKDEQWFSLFLLHSLRLSRKAREWV